MYWASLLGNQMAREHDTCAAMSVRHQLLGWELCNKSRPYICKRARESPPPPRSRARCLQTGTLSKGDERGSLVCSE